MRIGMDGRAAFRACMIAGAILGVAAIALLALSNATPAHSDEAAWRAALGAIPISADPYGDGFRTVQARYATAKWRYADAGYSCMVWAGLLFLAGGLGRRAGWEWLTRSSRNGWRLAALAALAFGGAMCAAVAAVWLESARGLIPWWTHAEVGLIANVVNGAPEAALVVLLTAFGPLLAGRRQRVPLLQLRSARPVSNALASLACLALLVVAGLLISDAAAPGGWAASVAGAALAWLALNARALLIAPRAGA